MRSSRREDRKDPCGTHRDQAGPARPGTGRRCGLLDVCVRFSRGFAETGAGDVVVDVLVDDARCLPEGRLQLVLQPHFVWEPGVAA